MTPSIKVSVNKVFLVEADSIENKRRFFRVFDFQSAEKKPKTARSTIIIQHSGSYFARTIALTPSIKLPISSFFCLWLTV